jgi:hypothetical protein
MNETPMGAEYVRTVKNAIPMPKEFTEITRKA